MVSFMGLAVLSILLALSFRSVRTPGFMHLFLSVTLTFAAMVCVAQSADWYRQSTELLDRLHSSSSAEIHITIALDEDPHQGVQGLTTLSGSLISVFDPMREISNHLSSKQGRIRGLAATTFDTATISVASIGSQIELTGEFSEHRDGVFIRSPRSFQADRVVVLEVVGKAPSPGRSIGDAKRVIMAYINQRIGTIAYPAGILVKALILGRTDVDAQPLKELFRTAGVSHLLALSGMHLEIFGGVILYVFTPMLGRRGSEMVRMVFGWVYVLVVGMRPSLVRASLGVTWKCVNRLVHTTTDPVTALMFALYLQSSLFPSHLPEVSFLLSYAAMAGIILESRRIRDLLPRLIPRFFREGIGMACAAFIFTMPFSAAIFGCIYPVGIIASIPIGLLVTIFMMFSLIMLLPISGLAGQWMHFCLAYIFRIIVKITESFSRIPSVVVSEEGKVIVICISLILLVATRMVESRIYRVSEITRKEYEFGASVRFSLRTVEIPR